jgi:hypothetical protein
MTIPLRSLRLSALKNSVQKCTASAGISLIFFSTVFSAVAGATPAHASNAASIEGANIQPTSTTDFASASFYQSLQNLHADHANSVSLIIPLAQSNVSATGIYTTGSTPTDASLVTAISEAHALGMSVTLKIHVDPQDGQWRAFINPSDRATWFANYGTFLQHYALLANANSVEQLVIGTELLDMSSATVNASNTSYWDSLIANVRSVYSGKLGYAANWGPSGTNVDEKNQIAFWNKLDFAGIDAYYPLATSNDADTSVPSLVSGLQQSDIPAFEKKVALPIEITEVGYRSANGTLTSPGDSSVGYGVNDTLQANAYQALFSYLSSLGYIEGVYIWDWKSNPYAGGSSDSDYTPQGKPAETVMSTWYSGAGDATAANTAAMLQPLTATVNFSGTSGQLNVPVTVTSQVQNSASYAQNNVLIDTEIYDQNGMLVFQKFEQGQTIAASNTYSATASWTPTYSGTYTAKIGVFGPNWSPNITWNNDAASFTTGNAVSGTSTSTPIATSTTPVASSTPPIATSTPIIPVAPVTPVLPVAPVAPASYSAVASSLTTSVSTPATFTATVTDSGGASTNTLVDLELYDSNNKQVFQTFTGLLSFAAGEQKQFQLTFTPPTIGTYRLAVGVFSNDWSQNYYWNNQAALLTSASTPSVPVTPVVPVEPPVVPVPPVDPVTPPVVPVTPPVVASTTPVAPIASSTPVVPVIPVAPVIPIASTTPVIPVVPVTPVVTNSTGIIYPGSATDRLGTSVDFTGKNFGHEESVVITYSNGGAAVQISQAHADGGGNFSTGSLSVPSTPGTYTYTFVGQNSGITGTSLVTITS